MNGEPWGTKGLQRKGIARRTIDTEGGNGSKKKPMERSNTAAKTTTTITAMAKKTFLHARSLVCCPSLAKHAWARGTETSSRSYDFLVCKTADPPENVLQGTLQLLQLAALRRLHFLAGSKTVPIMACNLTEEPTSKHLNIFLKTERHAKADGYWSPHDTRDSSTSEHFCHLS